MPRGTRRLDARWRYRTKAGDAAPAVDGDMRTAWTVARPLKGDEFFEVVFGRPGALTLLGARTLEGLNLRVDAKLKKLVAGRPLSAA